MAGIYVHIPFCKSKCTYCDFTSYPERINQADAYVSCLFKEIKLRGYGLSDKLFHTVYIGGGTPSILPAEHISGLIRLIKSSFNLITGAEITIEINPGTASLEKIESYLKAGINRFSIGLQSAQDYHLSNLNRPHTAEDFLKVCGYLKGENISADILIGLENQTQKEIEQTVELAIAGKAEHISLYALKPEEGTPLYSKYLNGDLPAEDEIAQFYQSAVSFLKEKGFERYEVSNFCRGDKYSKHNLNYWKRGNYIGMGTSACSFMDGVRFTNTHNFDDYIKCIISNKFPVVSSEQITAGEARFEKIMLALRTAQGLDIDAFNAEFAADFNRDFNKALSKNINYLEPFGNGIRIKDEYLFVQNSIITDFLQ